MWLFDKAGSKTVAAALLVGASLALAACGFRPLYGERSAASVSAPELAAVQIDTIPNREGQIVRNSLLDKMRPRGGAQKELYRLSIALSVGRESFGIRADDTATRSSMTMVASYTLSDIATGQALLSASSRAVSSYNILDSDFATYISENDAMRRTAVNLSEEIKTRIAIFLSSRKAG